MTFPYDVSSKTSIVEYGKRLKGRTLRSVCSDDILESQLTGKGTFGQLLEKYYFQYEPNSDSAPDFPNANLELKSSPLKQLKGKNQFRSKERLVLNIINYRDLINQDFYSSSFWKKNASMLLVFYLHELNVNVIDYVIQIVDEWSFPNVDLEIIKKDWFLIRDKVAAGKAHELSEGDTFYLGACTKGGRGGSLREQPESTILAKQRAFSLKQGYVNHIIATLAGDDKQSYGKLIANVAVAKALSIEDIVINKFARLIGKTDRELVSLLKLDLNPKAKDYYSNISHAVIKNIFKVPNKQDVESYIEEFSKADITVRTVRLNASGTPEEDISFPTFRFDELVDETWETSSFKASLERKFLFVFFQIQDKNLVLKRVKFWNMPYEHLNAAKDVWEATQKVVIEGNIVANIHTTKTKKTVRKTNFPSKKFSSIAHVRPHAQNANDTYPLPTIDKFTSAQEYTKHCFWLNSGYIRDEIYLK